MKPNMSDVDYLKVALEQKLKGNYLKYKETLSFVCDGLLSDQTILTTSKECLLQHP